MLRIFERLRAWWSKPSARKRILAVLSHTEWMRGSEVREAAGISGIAFFYIQMEKLEIEGLVWSKPEPGPIPAARGGRRGKIYRLRFQ